MAAFKRLAISSERPHFRPNLPGSFRAAVPSALDRNVRNWMRSSRKGFVVYNDPVRLNSPFTGVAICLILLFSPVGAPLIGVLISTCAPDSLVEPTGPFATGFSYCGTSRPIERLYQHAVMLSMLPMAFAGPIFGGFLTLTWWTGAIGTAVSCVWYLWRAVASATIEKL